MIISHGEDQITSLSDLLSPTELDFLIGVNFGFKTLSVDVCLVDQRVLQSVQITSLHLRANSDFFISNSSVEKTQESVPYELTPSSSIGLVDSEAHVGFIPVITEPQSLLLGSDFDVLQVIL